MSITYKSRTPYSDQSDPFSPPNEHINSPKQGAPPLINPSLHRDFFNAIQLRHDKMTLGAVPWIHPKHNKENTTDLLESISSENLNKMLSENSQMIMVDVRSFGLYFQSRIKNAINLAVPSVLLKRASYTLNKVCDSVTMNMGERLRNWSKVDCILFYDHTATNPIHSSNSATAILVGSKLKEAGYKGHLYYLKGWYICFIFLFIILLISIQNRWFPCFSF
jgi:protein-tyrosine phosphatase